MRVHQVMKTKDMSPVPENMANDIQVTRVMCRIARRPGKWRRKMHTMRYREDPRVIQTWVLPAA